MTDTPFTVAVDQSAPLALRSRGLTKTYGSGQAAVTAVDHVDLDIGAGVLTSVMGPSGSGKTTLVHLLAGLDRPDSGRCGWETMSSPGFPMQR